jgi:protein-S-isoprenylcysteine O-methyltransferase Ste14
VEILRFGLFLGLVLRMLHVDVLRRRNRVHRAVKPGIRLVKLFKGTIRGFLAFQTLFLDLFPISSQPSDLIIMIGAAIYLIGLATTVLGRVQLGENWVDLEDYRVLPKQSLVTRGLYRFIRHPIYAGDFLLFVGLELALNSWLVLGAFIIIPIMIRQALLEEALLLQVSRDYDAYCKRTRRFVPFIL